MLANVYAAALRGIEASLVKVEVDILSRGLPGWHMVGMLETAVKESRDRVSSALRNSGYTVPNRKTVINLSPADMKKGGAHYDLAIAVGLLKAAGICRPKSPKRFLIAGELSLTGEVLPAGGVLLMSLAARSHDLDGVICPAGNEWEARLADIGEVVAVGSLCDAVGFLEGDIPPPSSRTRASPQTESSAIDFNEVRGQPFAKRGLEIAAAGSHNVAMRGPPGTGKTMLAERLPTILPPLTHEEALEAAKILSVHGLLREVSGLPTCRPFRAPHHSASYAGLIGGSDKGLPRMGEISLAHNGVLFLDEMAEFRRDVLEALRQPLESGEVRIVRVGASLRYPARFMLVAAFNPCRCGYLSHPAKPCICTVQQIRTYRSKLSGPLLDRIDLHIEVGPPPHEALIESFQEEDSATIGGRVIEARKRQASRYGVSGKCNANIAGREVTKFCRPCHEGKAFLRDAAARYHLSARSVHRVLKVARTIADLADSDAVLVEHIAEALQFRPTLEDVI